MKDDPELEKGLATVKFGALVKIGDVDKTLEYGTHLAETIFKDQPQGLNFIAWTLVEKPGDKPNPKLMKFALQLAKNADKLAEGKDGAIADTLAKAYYENGDVTKALENQERALKLVKGTPQESDESMKERLKLYQEKAGKL